jgi:hypothetical protein
MFFRNTPDIVQGKLRFHFLRTFRNDTRAIQRIIDNVPGLIDTKFVKTFAADLQANLIREFKLGIPEAHGQCAEYLTEDPVVLSRRTDLKQRLNMLESFQKDLLRFGGNMKRDGEA